MKKRRLLALLLALVMSLGLIGCGSKTNPNDPQNTEGTAKKDSLKIAFTSEPPSLTTCDHDSLIAVGINMLTYNGLTRINMATLEPELDLASDYRIENEVEWIFTIKQGVKFHNGEELTADDVVASLLYAKSVPSSVNYTRNWEKVEALDTYTVKITTPRPYANVLADLGYHFNWIMPKSLIESGHNFNEDPIGTGPYKFVKWVSGTSLTFEKFDDYFYEHDPRAPDPKPAGLLVYAVYALGKKHYGDLRKEGRGSDPAWSSQNG